MSIENSIESIEPANPTEPTVDEVSEEIKSIVDMSGEELEKELNKREETERENTKRIKEKLNEIKKSSVPASIFDKKIQGDLSGIACCDESKRCASMDPMICLSCDCVRKIGGKSNPKQ